MAVMRCVMAAACVAALPSLAPARAAPIRAMPYPEAIYFGADLRHIPCVYADVPDWLCAWVPLPPSDPRKAPVPHPDPRKGAAQ